MEGQIQSKFSAMLFMPVIQAVAHGRQENFVRRPASSNEPAHIHLRLTDDEFGDVCGIFHAWRGQGHWHTSVRRMQTFLLYLASGGYHRQNAYTMGISKSAAIMQSREVADFFMDISLRHINFPHMDELDQLGVDLVDVNGVQRRVVLFIDGVII